MTDARANHRRTLSLTGERFFAQPWWGLWVGVAMIGAVLIVAVVIPSHPLSVDSHWSNWMRESESGFLHHVALVFNALGHGLGRILSLAAIGAVLLVTRRWLALIAFGVSETVTPLAVNAIKLIVDRPRPPHELLHVAASSYPSGHVAYAGATAVALVVAFTRPGGRRVLWWLIAALAVAAMAWSRTYLQVHWLSDAVAGGVLGVGIALATFAAGQILTPLRRPPSSG